MKVHNRFKLSVRLPILGYLFLLAATGISFAKDEQWLKVTTPNFIVYSDTGEKQTRQVAAEFEQFRAAIQTAIPSVKLGTQPIIILAVKNEKGLKEILPAPWEEKGRVKPAGVFQQGREKDYIALRVDAGGFSRYGTVYHEYIHRLVSNYGSLISLWLNEGLAEFYAHTELRNKEVHLGQPSSTHIATLRNHRLLPLDVLFEVDHKSEHYNENNKASIFYSQSWALAHMLQMGEPPWTTRFQNYLALISQGSSEREARTEAFGDLKELEKALEKYIRRASFNYIVYPADTRFEKDSLEPQPLTPAQTMALKGEFLLATQRPVEARAFLEEGMRLDPEQASNYANLGLLLQIQGDETGSLTHFRRAVELDTTSALAHYYVAEGMRGEDSNAEMIEKYLLKAISLNSNFAPPYGALAHQYLYRNEKLEAALSLSRMGAQLEPASPYYVGGMIRALLQLERLEEAEGVVARLQENAKTDQEIQTALTALEEVKEYKDYLARRAEFEAARAEVIAPDPEAAAVGADSAGVQPGMRADQTDKAEFEPQPETHPETTKAREPMKISKAAPVEVSGEVLSARCAFSDPPSMSIVLLTRGIEMELEAPDVNTVEFFTDGWKPDADFHPCTHLKGLKAKISYRPADAEGRQTILRVYMRK